MFMDMRYVGIELDPTEESQLWGCWNAMRKLGQIGWYHQTAGRPWLALDYVSINLVR